MMEVNGNILLEDEIVTRINTSKLQNIVDSAQGVNVTGRIATDSIDVGSGGGITVQPVELLIYKVRQFTLQCTVRR